MTVIDVIDVLDECESDAYKDDVRVILQLLQRVQTSKCVRLRFLLTRRSELPIRLGFKKIKGDLQNLDLHDAPMFNVPVRHLHLSFREFPLDTETKRTKDSEQFWIDEKSVHVTNVWRS